MTTQSTNWYDELPSAVYSALTVPLRKCCRCSSTVASSVASTMASAIFLVFSAYMIRNTSGVNAIMISAISAASLHYIRGSIPQRVPACNPGQPRCSMASRSCWGWVMGCRP